MKKPGRPSNEARRQDILDAYDILDTRAEAVYDDLCRLASEICQTPVAIITLVDRDRQWFKSKVGITAESSPRDQSFCGHVINGHDVLNVPDLRRDERFADNPVVTGPANIQFYAGAPLIVPTGEVLGTICVLDHRPRTLTTSQIDTLRILARSVVAQLELGSHIRRMAEREQLVNQTLLQQVNEQRSAKDFFARMCHELRTPVAGVVGMLDTMPIPGLSEDQRAQLTMARQAGEGLLGLVNNILDLSALENQRMTTENLDFDLNNVVHRTLNLFLTSARQKNVELKFIPEPDDETWVSGDPTRIAQILTNLVGNAVKFTERGAVSVTLARRNGQIEIAVGDTGPGIPADAVERIFDPYVQADETIRRRFGGTGLGLPITKEIAELLGGQVSCTSTPGVGSTFTVRVPMRPAVKPNPTPVKGLRVLVVDDVTINQKVIRAILTPHQAHVDLAASGEEAMVLFAQNTYDLVLMDRYMPGLDGLETTRLMRQMEVDTGREHTPIFGASAASVANELSERQHFIAAGADDSVAKPLRIDELWCKVNRLRALRATRAA